MAENIEKVKRYQVIEDNGGGLTLVTFDGNGNVDYFNSGYEYRTAGRLLQDIEEIKNGGDPVRDYWDGNEEDPQEAYDNMTSYKYGWTVVADNDGIYTEEMGNSARVEFGIDRE